MSEKELDALAAEAEKEDGAGDYIPGKEGAAKDPAAGPPEPPTSEVLKPLLMITFGLVASRKGEHWALNEMEAEEAAKAYGDVIDKYYPEAKGGPEVTAVIVTLALVGPRIGRDKMIAMEKAKAEAEKKGDGKESEGE